MRAVNLIPVEQRSGQPVGAGRSQGGAYAVLAVVGGFALMAYLYGEASHQISSRGTQAAALSNEARQTQAAAEKLAPYASFIAMREQRMQTLDSLVDSRFDWAHVLHEFGRVMPPETSISSLSGTVGNTGASGSSAASSTTTSSTTASSGSSAAASSSVASATPSGSVPTFALTGCAINQPSVALTLERLHLIDGVTEVTLQSSASSTSGGGAGAGTCPAHDLSFAATITFDPLPSTSAVAAATRTVSDSAGTGSTAAAASGKKASTK
jgi:Tfp pilus assembly protein PilN